ncbi:larval cuticle protein A3A-like isoform X2 [Harmonia axyridis]|uniref:larval cuticle protein A3A-like isoform X2 n=1 Tax=Harmonia axyridis TaxID=115357 RepID=UPI001E278DB3|nr:larval cuticle protein A3A-like isoform X2 [Harmonia axyridis]
MAFKFIAFAALLAYAHAGDLIGAHLAASPLAYAAPVVAKVAAPVAVARAEPYDPNPQYQFGYDVQDALTGDSKSQVESRSGDVVQGQYSLNDADGTRRIVDYTADPINGFNAVVRKEPLVAKTVVAAPAVAAVRAAPVVAAAPLTRSAPLLHSSPLLAQPALSAPLIRSAPLLAQPAYATSLIRSSPLLAQPALASAPLLRSGPLLAQSAPLIAHSAYAAPAYYH